MHSNIHGLDLRKGDDREADSIGCGGKEDRSPGIPLNVFHDRGMEDFLLVRDQELQQDQIEYSLDLGGVSRRSAIIRHGESLYFRLRLFLRDFFSCRRFALAFASARRSASFLRALPIFFRSSSSPSSGTGSSRERVKALEIMFSHG
jgi:hypothetical protein